MMDEGPLGSVALLTFSLGDNGDGQPEDSSESLYGDLEPFPFTVKSELCALRLGLPKGSKVRPESKDGLLLMLSGCSAPLSYEIIADHKAIHLQMVCRREDRMLLHSQMKAYFPELVISENEEWLFDMIEDDKPSYFLDFGLTDEFMRPLQSAQSFELDPLTPLFGILDSLERGEQAVLQILFSGVINPWAESALKSVSDGRGGSFFEDAPEMLSLARDKVNKPLFAVAVRLLTQSDSGREAQSLAFRLSSALVGLSRSPSNCLQSLQISEEEGMNRYADLYYRTSHRLGMLLNSRELGTIVHLPSASIQSPKLHRDLRKTKALPDTALGHDFVLGTNIHQGKSAQVTLSSGQRLRHMHIIGATGTGKIHIA